MTLVKTVGGAVHQESCDKRVKNVTSGWWFVAKVLLINRNLSPDAQCFVILHTPCTLCRHHSRGVQ